VCDFRLSRNPCFRLSPFIFLFHPNFSFPLKLPPGLGGTKTQFAKNRFAVLARKKPEAFLRLSPSPCRGEEKLTQATLGRATATKEKNWVKSECGGKA